MNFRLLLFTILLFSISCEDWNSMGILEPIKDVYTQEGKTVEIDLSEKYAGFNVSYELHDENGIIDSNYTIKEVMEEEFEFKTTEPVVAARTAWTNSLTKYSNGKYYTLQIAND